MNKLAYWRTRRRLTVRALAEKSTVARATINELELDRRKAHLMTLSKLAQALDIEVDELLSLLSVPPKPDTS